MKIGLDIHKVVDKYPELFSNLTRDWKNLGHEICIVTGQERSVVEPELMRFNITYTHFYSIVDYHLANGTNMWHADPSDKSWWMSQEDWMPSKGNYARDAKLDVHFDDQVEYAQYFPNSCTFVHVKDNFDKFILHLLK